MSRSMTGFGMAEGPVAGGRLLVEIRTVNHRHFNVQFKTPYSFQEMEAQLRDLLRGDIDRGHATVMMRWAEEPARSSSVQVNLGRARDVLDALTELQLELELDGEIDIGFVARQPDVLTVTAGEAQAPQWQEVKTVVAKALKGLGVARAREGRVLETEVVRRLDAIHTGLTEVENRAPARVTAERDRLRTTVAELSGGSIVNEDRLAQEIAILADKLDVTEEMVRLRAHLGAARAALEGDGPVGKQLGFLGQEMLREINTIGSKANDAAIAHSVIAMKGELEKFREQIENIE